MPDVLPVRGVYHSHTRRCKHAEGDVPDYARAAAAAGLERFGASDHTPLPDGRWPEVRMSLAELPAYEAAVAEARAAVPGLKVFQGMECDALPEHFAWYRDTFLARGYDYLIAACHYVTREGAEVSAFEHADTPASLRDCARRTVAAIESGLFAFVAHPDVFGSCNPWWSPDTAACARDICAAAAACNVPLELNSLGLRRGDMDTPSGMRPRYPWRPFWEVAAAQGCSAVLSTDAHRPGDIAHGLATLATMAAKLGIAVVDPLDRREERSGRQAAISAR